MVSIDTSIEWPPRSGQYIRVPEIDRAAFFPLDEARAAINVGQAPLLDRLVAAIAT
jgi:predicted NUDIX family NTP pyrophosphohydrolase